MELESNVEIGKRLPFALITDGMTQLQKAGKPNLKALKTHVLWESERNWLPNLIGRVAILGKCIHQ
jgi:hypothetical protein